MFIDVRVTGNVWAQLLDRARLEAYPTAPIVHEIGGFSAISRKRDCFASRPSTTIQGDYPVTIDGIARAAESRVVRELQRASHVGGSDC
jgi:hypothetical protein